jgi:rubredoxin
MGFLLFESKEPTLCSPCKRLRIQLLPDPDNGDETTRRSGFRHSSAQQLVAQSAYCPLCALIKKSFERVGAFSASADFVEEHLRRFADGRILLRAGRQGNCRHPNGGANLASVEVLLDSGKDWQRGRFGLYAPPGESVNL